MGERRESKKEETRRRISDVATALFFSHGFDAVTVDDIAAAAKVSKMTVFNYFARKEELMLDREDDLLLLPFRRALRERPHGESPVDAIRAFVAKLTEEKQPLAWIDDQTVKWWRVVSASSALKARLRELAEEAQNALAAELGGPKPDGVARLTAGMVVLTVYTARAEAIRVAERGASPKKANAAFLALMASGLSAIERIADQNGEARVKSREKKHK